MRTVLWAMFVRMLWTVLKREPGPLALLDVTVLGFAVWMDVRCVLSRTEATRRGRR